MDITVIVLRGNHEQFVIEGDTDISGSKGF